MSAAYGCSRLLLALHVPNSHKGSPVTYRLAPILVFSLLCNPISASAQQIENAEQIGVGVVCDTADQINHYLRVHKGGLAPEAAVKVVTRNARSRALRVVAAAFIKGEELRR